MLSGSSKSRLMAASGWSVLPRRVVPDGAGDARGRQFPCLRLWTQAARDLIKPGLWAADHDVTERCIAPFKQPPSCFGRGQVQFARALDVLGIEFAAAATISASPRRARPTHQDQSV